MHHRFENLFIYLFIWHHPTDHILINKLRRFFSPQETQVQTFNITKRSSESSKVKDELWIGSVKAYLTIIWPISLREAHSTTKTPIHDSLNITLGSIKHKTIAQSCTQPGSASLGIEYRGLIRSQISHAVFTYLKLYQPPQQLSKGSLGLQLDCKQATARGSDQDTLSSFINITKSLGKILSSSK